MQRVYLDNNATTALDPRVLRAMLEDLNGPPGNPSSVHWFGKQARQKLNAARGALASFFRSAPEEILFTSSGTEAVNFFLKGLGKKGHLITSAIEHSCIYRTVQALEAQGLEVTYLPVDFKGAPCPESLKGAIRSDTIAIVLSAANSETGVKIDLKAISSIAHQNQIPLLIDAVGFIGKEPWITYPGISAVACSGHKFHAPKGVGALFLRSSCKIEPLITGGAQEYQLRAGTENLPGILGIAEAFRILSCDQIEISEHLLSLRERLEAGLKQELADLIINGSGPRVSNTSNLSFPGIDGETLLLQLDMAGIAVSHGSACASGAMEPSRVLLQMGIPRKIACSAIRFSVGRTNTVSDIDRAIETTSAIVKKMRAVC